MKLTLDIDGQVFRVDTNQACSLAIPLQFNGEQPNHFGANRATAKAIEADGFIGDTRRGGSCNVQTITFVPHCNGTHTESVSHIVNEQFAVGQLATSLLPATVITVMPKLAAECNDSYRPALAPDDKVISKQLLVAELSEFDRGMVTALVIRTLPNSDAKQSYVYDSGNQPPFLTSDAIEYLNQKGVRHLLVDFPSIDKMFDQGLLSNHHTFWNVPQNSHTTDESVASDKTITEMIFVPKQVNDGHYLLSLNIAAFESDAAPSRPVIYPLEKES